jgi:ABC-type transport system involved in cytochrome c biogenesis permease subunit
MSVVILRIAALLYAGSAAGYLVCFARPRYARAASAGYALLAAAFVVHAAAIGLACAEYGGAEFFTLRGGFVMLAWLFAGVYLVVQRSYHLPAVGAFIVPLLLVVLVPALFGSAGNPGVAPETIRTPSVTVHIVTAIGGVALFGIAFGVSLMYLLQEREVKGKHFGALFSRLPSLDALDRLTQRLIRLGFLVFTVALVAGAVTANAVWKSAWEWDPQIIRSIAVWALYGAMVQLRHSGWHGRRYALLTAIGFLLVMGSMVTLKSIPGATRHANTYENTTAAGGAQ